MNLPNQITLARLFVAIVFCAMIVQYDARQSGRDVWKLDVCLAIFVIAAVSDVVDGFLARRRNQVTSFGRLIDPFVDKVLICGAFVLLAGQNFGAPGARLTSLLPICYPEPKWVLPRAQRITP